MIRTRLLAAGVFGFAALTDGVIVQLLAWSRLAVVHPIWSAIVAAFVAALLAPWLHHRARDTGSDPLTRAAVVDGLVVTVLAYLLGVVAFTGLVAFLGPDAMRMVLMEGVTTGALTFLPTALLLGGVAGWILRALLRHLAV